jgi:monomeric isocitrate dehydrogenase
MYNKWKQQDTIQNNQPFLFRVYEATIEFCKETWRFDPEQWEVFQM